MAPKTELLTYAHVAQEKISPYVTSAKSAAVNSALTAKDYVLGIAVFFHALLDKYPPLKAFVYTLFGAAALPLAVFGGYGLITGGVILTIAATVIGIVQGGFLAFGAFVLFWFLLGALAVASIAAFWFTVSYFSFQVRIVLIVLPIITRVTSIVLNHLYAYITGRQETRVTESPQRLKLLESFSTRKTFLFGLHNRIHVKLNTSQNLIVRISTIPSMENKIKTSSITTSLNSF
jgi:hypothetical protein